MKQGKLTVEKIIGDKYKYYLCKCDCGGSIKILEKDWGKKTNCGFCHLRKKGKRKSLDLDREYNSPEYKRLRKSVYKRDGYKCVVCYARTKLNCHHLDGWDWCVSGRFEISNCVTLCGGSSGHHTEFHNIFGKGGNTKGQFEEFLHRYGKTLKDIL